MMMMIMMVMMTMVTNGVIYDDDDGDDDDMLTVLKHELYEELHQSDCDDDIRKIHQMSNDVIHPITISLMLHF